MSRQRKIGCLSIILFPITIPLALFKLALSPRFWFQTMRFMIIIPLTLAYGAVKFIAISIVSIFKLLLSATPTAKRKISKKHFDSMDGHEFEHFCADVLRRNGFCRVEVTRGSGDNGIDILAEKAGNTYAIQCKCYSSNIGNKAIQEAYSGKDCYNRKIGAVLTNQYFTPAAKSAAQKLGVALWDRTYLEQMIGR